MVKTILDLAEDPEIRKILKGVLDRENKLKQNLVLSIVCKRLSEVCLMLGKEMEDENKKIKLDEQAIQFDKLSEIFKIFNKVKP